MLQLTYTDEVETLYLNLENEFMVGTGKKGNSWCQTFLLYPQVKQCRSYGHLLRHSTSH